MIRRILGWFLACFLVISSVASAGEQPVFLVDFTDQTSAVELTPFGEDLCEQSTQGVTPLVDWAWTLAIEQYGHDVEGMIQYDSTYRFIQTQVGTAAADAMYKYRSTVAQELSAAANGGAFSPNPGGDAVYRALRYGHGVSETVATNAKVGSLERIRQIYSWILGGCGG